MTIRVIEKLFLALESMHSGAYLPLSGIAKRTGINKATLCNILKTMCALGYVENDGGGQYRLSGKLADLGNISSVKATVTHIALEFCTKLANEVKESGVIAVLDQNHVNIVAQASFEQTFMLNISVYKNLSLWHSTSGRILAACLSTAELNELTAGAGFPGEEWDNISDMPHLQQALAPMRDRGYAEMSNQQEMYSAYSVPFFDANEKICGCLGLAVPHFRLSGGADAVLLDKLTAFGKKITKRNIDSKLTARDWRHVPRKDIL